VEPAVDLGKAAPRGPARGPLTVVFEILGRLFSIAVLAWAIFLGRSSPLVFLWGLWIEEVLSLAGLSVRKSLVRREGASRTPLGLYFVFPAAHLVFVLFFTLIGTTGMFSRGGAPRMAPPSPAAVARVAAALAAWTVIDVARAFLRRRRGGGPRAELASIDKAARLALFLPHVTIIAGGFCLVMFGLGNWLAWGILAGKVLFELLAFTVAREKPRA
jgi:hypothetical protein